MEKTQEQKFNITAIICGAGKGQRAKLEENKIFAIMPNGRCVLENALLAFNDCERVDEIIITANEEDFSRVQKNVDFISKPCAVVIGGQTRTQSVINAVNKARGEYVLIHDGARPYITKNAVNRCIDALLKFGSAVLCAPCKDTVITLSDQNLIANSSREDKLLAQTPQCFNKEKLAFAFSQIKSGETFTDEAGVYCKYVEQPHPVINEENNKKLTTPEDFCFDCGLKVGVGFDLHTLAENRELVLGGIKIPHGKGLLGHSDADVLTHAVMDALLSALSLRDIGYHFSDKDAQFKDVSSMLLLSKVMQMINGKGYCVNNISAVIMAEKPKLSPYVERITSNLASALAVETEQIGITCTTCEKIGLIGREEGIAVQAFCSLKPIK